MPGKDERLELRCSTAEKEFFELAAATEGLKVSAWLRDLATTRAHELLPEGAAAEPAATFTPGYGLNDKEE